MSSTGGYGLKVLGAAITSAAIIAVGLAASSAHAQAAPAPAGPAHADAALPVETSPAESAPIESVSVETVTGETLSRGLVVAADASRVTFAEGDSTPADSIRRLSFASAASPSALPSGPVVHLAGGGRLHVQDAVLVEDACRVTRPDGSTATLELNDVAAIQWQTVDDPVWSAVLAKPSAEFDQVVVASSPQSTVIRAFIESISLESLEFDWEKQTRSLLRGQVVGVVFVRPETRVAAAKLLVTDRADNRLPAVRLRQADEGGGGRFLCELVGGSRISIPISDVQSIDIRSTRVASLTDLPPVAVAERPLAAFPRRWQANRNVRGEPLLADGQVYAQGIGVQAGTSLQYDIDETAEQFVAILALDSPPGHAGDCEFVVLADGRELARRRLRAGDAAVPVRVPLSGAGRLELRVDYGENLDFGDHANWCDVHLVLAARGDLGN